MNETLFNGKGSIYAQFRPSYPQAFIKYLYTDLGITSEHAIADVGSGTGILTRLLLERGNRVYAVEPNADMRMVAQTDLREFEHLVSVNGTAENTLLERSSVDFITVAQAFHWFDRKQFRAECRRILKPNGAVILVWNSRDEQSELVRENDRINRLYCTNYKGFSGGMGDSAEDNEFSDFFNGRYETKVFENNLLFHADEFIGRNLSASYAVRENDPLYRNYIGELQALFDRYSKNGIVAMPHFTRSYAGNV